MSKSSNLLAISSLFLTASLWGVVWYPLRALESVGLVGLWSILLIYGGAAVLAGFLLPQCWTEIKQNSRLLFVLALGAAWCNVAFILAIIDGNVIRIMLLFYLSPVWSTLLGWWLLSERLTTREWITLVVAMSGAVIMLWDVSLGFPWPQDTADWLSLTAGMAFSISNIAVRKLQAVSIKSKTLVSWWGVSYLTIAWIFVSDASIPTIEPSVIFWAAGIGIIVVTLMTITVQYGVTHMPVYRSAVILLFELVVGAVSSQWLTDEVVLMSEWMGGGLIVMAAYFSAKS
ncbi:MAG: DMT family transporter [Thiohalomonadales bacterium]